MKCMQQPRRTARLLGLCLLALGSFGCGGEDTDSAVQDAVAATPVPAELSDVGLSAIWGSAPDDVWVVGERGTIAHYDGESWSLKDSGIPERLHSVHGSGPTDVWAVGEEGAILHWDGESWSMPQPVQSGETLLGAWSASPDRLWVVGVSLGGNSGSLRHFDGDRWQRVLVPHSSSLWSVWGSSAKDVWAVGSNEEQAGFLMRGDGNAFDLHGYEGASLRGIWGSAPEDVWVVPYEGPFQHWDGESWTTFDVDPELRLRALAGTGKDDVWAVGAQGAILHWDGERWERRPSGTDAQLIAIWAASREDVWAVGASGAIVHWNGKAWQRAGGAQ